MSDRLHIIITGDEGKAQSFLFSKRRLKTACFLTASLFITLTVISYNAYHFFNTNKALNNQVTELNRELQKSNRLKHSLALKVQDLQELNSNQAEDFQQEKTTLLNTAVSELEERSSMIERIMSNIGIEVKDVVEDRNNSGGPFLAPRDSAGTDLVYRSDRYMETINFLPLGRPIPGPVTSAFGHRTDPVNGKKGYHSGVDMRGRYGQKVVATADGIVKKAFFNGSYGKYVEINHGNGYTTKFAHMKKILVKRGDRVKRGQAIGTVGNSGRSTGPHLHYEVCLDKQPINPSKFLKVNKLYQPVIISQLNAKKKHNVSLTAKNEHSASSDTSEN
ncbi:metalloendopeptidase-like membrane protein [Desulfocapsa sulfexigens DSM 10523]|uniref:Metalloendopeptidase-like membrane protein n=1 Tax=Desulfocapsa sulfexigens (strain DSM 10523 / SB164P1) TaxID=1167006 RepID=M1P0K8_DESSD|nr:M23 family metallopeptidase [Desulfocapsa sulfexigens]AGF77028.1 metalloendopeptidase-like membrane protein [Desulfocapsa sulfexigens DSM 10523]